MTAEISLVRRPGRPSKLVEDTKKRLLEAISAGNYYDDACRYAGVSVRAFRNWMIWGEENKAPQYVQLMQDVKKAESDAVVRMVAQWRGHMPGNWQAIATFLERRHPEKWGRRALEVTGKGGGPIEIDMRVLLGKLAQLAGEEEETLPAPLSNGHS